MKNVTRCFLFAPRELTKEHTRLIRERLTHFKESAKRAQDAAGKVDDRELAEFLWLNEKVYWECRDDAIEDLADVNVNKAMIIISRFLNGLPPSDCVCVTVDNWRVYVAKQDTKTGQLITNILKFGLRPESLIGP